MTTPSLTNPNPKREAIAKELLSWHDTVGGYLPLNQAERAQKAMRDAAIALEAPSPGDPARAALEKARPLVADRVAAQSGRIGDREYASILAEVDAVLSVSTPTGEGEEPTSAEVKDARAVANVMEALWLDAEAETARLASGLRPSDEAIAEAFHEHRRETQPGLPPWSEVAEDSGIWKHSYDFAARLHSLRPAAAPAADGTGMKTLTHLSFGYHAEPGATPAHLWMVYTTANVGKNDRVWVGELTKDAVEAWISSPRTQPTVHQLVAAMDAFYPGENWRADLGCALESSLRDMRAALTAAFSHPQQGGERDTSSPVAEETLGDILADALKVLPYTAYTLEALQDERDEVLDDLIARLRAVVPTAPISPAESSGGEMCFCNWSGGNDTIRCSTCGAEYAYAEGEQLPACPRRSGEEA